MTTLIQMPVLTQIPVDFSNSTHFNNNGLDSGGSDGSGSNSFSGPLQQSLIESVIADVLAMVMQAVQSSNSSGGSNSSSGSQVDPYQLVNAQGAQSDGTNNQSNNNSILSTLEMLLQVLEQLQAGQQSGQSTNSGDQSGNSQISALLQQIEQLVQQLMGSAGGQQGQGASGGSSDTMVAALEAVLAQLLQMLSGTQGQQGSGDQSGGQSSGSTADALQSIIELLSQLLNGGSGQQDSGNDSTGSNSDTSGYQPPVKNLQSDSSNTNGSTGNQPTNDSPPISLTKDQSNSQSTNSNSNGSNSTNNTSNNDSTTQHSTTTTSSSGAPDNVKFSSQWNTVPFVNNTNEPITFQLTMGAGQSLPAGVDSDGKFTVAPHSTVEKTFATNGPGFNVKQVNGDGSAFTLDEFTFSSNGNNHTINFDTSYIRGANNGDHSLNIVSSDGQESGYRGNLMANAPDDVKAGNWGIKAPLTNTSSDDKGPNDPTNSAAKYLYSEVAKGKGYVGVGLPAENTNYDDASTLGTNGSVAVVIS